MSDYFERMKLIKLGLLPKESGAKPKKTIPKISEKRKKEMADEKKFRGDEDTELVKFMKRCIKQFTGYCLETGLKTETRIYKYAICSVCHILSRQQCKSVQYHPLNWIELEPGFHVKFDKMSWEEREKLGCWPVIQQRLIMIYPDLHPSERRHFPDSVLKYMEKNEPF